MGILAFLVMVVFSYDQIHWTAEEVADTLRSAYTWMFPVALVWFFVGKVRKNAEIRNWVAGKPDDTRQDDVEYEESYATVIQIVHDLYRESRSEFYGLTPLQSAGRTLVELEGMTESSDLEHLMVLLATGKLLQEEQAFDEEFYDDLLKHYEQKTALLHKDELETEDYNRLVSDLENIINTWK